MKVIIAGAGEVGTHAAEVLTEGGHRVTVVDTRESRLAGIDDSMDVRTVLGNSANAEVLLEAGANDPDAALVAATSSDEVNLLTATVGRGLGVGKTVARVHHSAYFEERGFNYREHLGITRLICPEYATATAIAALVRNPAAIAVETFASGQIEMQEFGVEADAPAIGKSLIELSMPQGVRLAAVRRGGDAFLPVATTVIEPRDVVILVGNNESFEQGRQLFQLKRTSRKRVLVMGGSTMGVWLCRVLRDRGVTIKLFEPDRARAEDLAAKLDDVTVVHVDTSDLASFEEHRIGELDAFIATTDDDEHNILTSAWAKSAGVKQSIVVVQRWRYVQLIGRVGIDHVFSPRRVAVSQISRTLDESPLLRMASLAEGVIDAQRVKVAPGSPVVGKRLRDLRLSPDWMVAAIQHEGRTYVPGADDQIPAGCRVMVIGRHGQEKKLRQAFGPA